MIRELAAIVAMSLASPAFAALPLAGGVSFGTTIALADGASTLSLVDGDGWVGTPALASLGVSVQIFNSGNSVYAFAGGDGVWNSAESGSFIFEGGWEFDAPDAFAAGQSARLNTSPDPDWFYSFTATSNGTFTLDYALVGLGDTFGLQGWNFAWDSGSQFLGNVFDPTTSGQVSFALLSGQSYTVSLKNNANISTSGTLDGYAGTLLGDFAWTITEARVPEPATWAMLITGFGLIGAALRRNRWHSIA